MVAAVLGFKDRVQLFQNLTLFYKCSAGVDTRHIFFPTPLVGIVEAMQKNARKCWLRPRANVQKVGSSGVSAAAELSRPLSACWLTAQQPLLTRTTFTEGFYTHICTHAQIQTHTDFRAVEEWDIRKPDKTSFWSEFQKEDSPCSCI